MSLSSHHLLAFVAIVAALLCLGTVYATDDFSSVSENDMEDLVQYVYDSIADEMEDDEANCGCGWANSYTCGTNDGTPCNIQCCARFRGGGKPKNSNNNNNNNNNQSGWQIAKTTRYWDASKPSCSWSSNARNANGFVKACKRDGRTRASPNAPNGNGVGGGDGSAPAFTCTDQQPFTQGGIMYGFAASNTPCCQCFELEFLNYGNGNYHGQLAGRKMKIQVTNRGGDLGQNHFDLMIPGGGLGIFDGLTPQFGRHNWGARYGGYSSRSECNNMPSQLRRGCFWRFDDFKNADNPAVKFRKIRCPSQLTNISGCSA